MKKYTCINFSDIFQGKNNDATGQFRGLDKALEELAENAEQDFISRVLIQSIINDHKQDPDYKNPNDEDGEYLHHLVAQLQKVDMVMKLNKIDLILFL